MPRYLLKRSPLLLKPFPKKLRQGNIQRLQHFQKAAKAQVLPILIAPILRAVDLMLVGKLFIIAVATGFSKGLYPGSQVRKLLFDVFLMLFHLVKKA